MTMRVASFLVLALLQGAAHAQWVPIDSPETEPHRNNHACVWDPARDRIYMYGGSSTLNYVFTSICQSYDPTANVWTDLASMRTPRGFIKGLLCRGKLYALGGCSNSQSPLDSSEVYDIAANSWSPIAPLPRPLYSYQAVVWRDSLIYLLGGSDGSRRLDSAWIYNPLTNTWTSGAPMLAPAGDGDACIAGDTIYFAGAVGMTYFDSLMRIGIIDPATPSDVQWSWGTRLPAGRAYGPVVRLDGRIYWFGGSKTGSGPTADAYEYDPSSGEIAQLPFYPTPVLFCCLGVARESHG
jgi:Kelch motif